MNQSLSTSPNSPPLEIFSSRQFPEWLHNQGITLAVTTYQTGQLIFFGVNPKGRLSGFHRLFDRAMGLYVVPERLYLGTKYQLWQIDNVLAPGQLYNSYDKLYIPRIAYTTADLDIHDIIIESSSPDQFTFSPNRIIFASPLLNCLATVSHRNSCTPVWTPPFISKVVNEDRCHLNGLAVVDGKPAYVTVCSQSDIIDGWRDRRHQGGAIIDVRTNQTLITGLSMPHSPRFYQGKLWVLNSGAGEFGYIDNLETTPEFIPITFCPGYLRGLAFWQNFAIVGLSKPRDKTFSGLPLDATLISKDAEARCGLMIIDLKSGSVVEWLRLEGMITELYDVQVIPGTRHPMILGFQTDEISRLVTLDPMIPLYTNSVWT